MATFYVWATLMTEESVHGLIAGLVNNDCKVSPLAKSGSNGIMGEVSCLAALSIDRDFRGHKDHQNKMMELTKGVLNKMDAHWHSIIITQVHGSSTWSGEAPGNRRK